MIDLGQQIKQIMKTLQNLTHYQFSEQTFALGEKIINVSIYIAAFAFMIFPFAILFIRLC